MTVTSNLAGVPALNIPALTKKGKPCGIQLISKMFNEKAIFYVANELTS
jgi:Asp-tRNA(Asn)/Glu-tRNA(Gln) amidotransferase A subunit family amidase